MSYCFTNLALLNVSGCTALAKLRCFGNNLTSLNVSSCTALTSLDCSINNLTSLNVSGCTKLEYLNCYNNNLTSLNVSSCTTLKNLDCGTNGLTSLDISKNTALTSLSCRWNYLASLTLNASGYANLWKLDCRGNNLTSLSVSGCTKLEYLACEDNNLTILNMSGCTALATLYCFGNKITTLNVSGFAKLTLLSCMYNNLTSLNVAGCTALSRLMCGDNNLTSLNVSDCTKLEYLSCYNNNLTSLNVSGFTALTTLTCYDNNLTSLNVSGCTKLDDFSCRNNNLTSLNVSSCMALKDLSCSNNKLLSLDVTKNLALYRLWAGSNDFTSLDVSKNPALGVLHCNDNNLTSIDVSKNTKLFSLRCDNNRLTSIDVSKNLELSMLQCANNDLTSLDVSKNPDIFELNCSNNYLTFVTLPTQGLLYDGRYFTYAPQKPMVVGIRAEEIANGSLTPDYYVGTNETVDLSSQYLAVASLSSASASLPSAAAALTNYRWYYSEYHTAVEPGRIISQGNGLFTFDKELRGLEIYCVMTNSVFPDLNLTTVAFRPRSFEPDTPTNFQSKAPAYNFIALSWEFAPDVTGYVLQYKKSSEPESLWKAWMPDQETTATNVILTNLSTNTTYDFRIQATNDDGFSDWETASGRTSSAPAGLPTAVINDADSLSVQRGCSLSISGNGVDPLGRGLMYLWDFPGNGGFIEYPDNTTWFDTTHINGITDGFYTIRLKVRDADGNESPIIETDVSLANVKPTYYVDDPKTDELIAGRFTQWEFSAVSNCPIKDWEIDWGDGSDATKILGGPRTRIFLTHYFQKAGTYTITAKTTDLEGNVSVVTIGDYTIKERTM